MTVTRCKRRALLGIAAVAGFVSCSRKPPLPVFQTVPPFTLTSQSGLPFDSRDLKGRPWLASFFFATCAGPCPRLNTSLHQLQEQTYRYPDLMLVSFTVDPEHDTPEVLAAYAKRYRADPKRWVFLTGPEAVISALGRDVFQTGGIDTSRTHSTRVMLVDPAGRVRGHFPVETAEEFQSLLRAVDQLMEESAK